jgi:hypothetical protein
MSDKISREDAQAKINGLLVAEICRDFAINFRDVYPAHILARGVGPEQAFIGLAIKRGYLALPAVQPKVKPLEFIYGRAECATGVYVIESGKATGGGRWWAWAHNPDESDGFFMWQQAERTESEEAAKAAAQADYDARILSALEPAVQPDAAAIREAALREAADSLLECSVWCDSQERTDDGWRNGVMDARKHHTARLLALIDTGKDNSNAD